MKAHVFAFVCVAGTVISAGVLIAGPLSPPGGPVASTYKTLTEVEPRIAIDGANTPGDGTCLYKITKPGSYYLTDNVTGASGRSGIVIACGDVTLDLNGFALTGVAGSLAGVSFNVVSPTYSNIAVRNGTVKSWGQQGIVLDGTGRNATVQNVRALDNLSQGIKIGMTGALVQDCSTSGNFAESVLLGNSAVVEDCSLVNNGAHGLWVEDDAIVRGVNAVNNANIGIRTGSGARVSDCNVRAFQGVSMLVGSRSHVSECNITAVSTASAKGLEIGGGSIVARNNFVGGKTAINASLNCTIEDNHFDASLSQSSFGTAITFQSGSVVRNNVVNAYSVGYSTAASSSIVVGNYAMSCSTAFSIGAGNRYGVILVLPLNAPAANGAAASTMTTTDPYANVAQ